jgi:hypothetical protein
MNQNNQKKPNYFGKAFYNEYEGQFTGYSILLSAAELEDAKNYLGETGRVKITVKNGRMDPKQPYATIANGPAPKADGGQYQKKTYNSRPAHNEATEDLPF